MTDLDLQHDDTNQHWYACKVFFNRVFEVEDALKDMGVECYVPVSEKATEQHGVVKKKIQPLVSSLLFFRTTLDKAIDVEEQLRGKVMVYMRTSSSAKFPASIPDREMNIFILVTSSGDQGVEYLGADDARYHTGQLVEVTEGVFKGAVGRIKRIRGNHRLIVSINGVCAVATSYIPRSFLKPVSE